MSDEETKEKRSRRIHKEEAAIQRQVKIAKTHHAPTVEAHRYHKHHALDCGNPECFLCGNPRKTHKDKLTQQEKRLFQDVDQIRDKHSNGLPNDKD